MSSDAHVQRDDLPAGVRLTCSFDGSWFYVHYKGQQRAIWNDEDGRHSYGKPCGGSYITIDSGFWEIDDAIRAAIADMGAPATGEAA